MGLVGDDDTIVSGGAIGVDALAAKYSREELGREPLVFKPDYDKYPPRIAPLERNTTIVENSDLVLAFWDGKSRGTKNTIDKAKKQGVPVWIIRV